MDEQSKPGRTSDIPTISLSDTMFVDIPFKIFRMNKDVGYVALEDSTAPSINDPDVAFCVAAAFTGNKEEGEGPADLHVSRGRLLYGYKCPINTGQLLALPNGTVAIHPAAMIADDITEALNEKGSLFQQILLVKDGRYVSDMTRLNNRKNGFRAACVMNDGSFTIIETDTKRTLEGFSNILIKFGVKDAIYLDKGGWKYGWYRLNPKDRAVEIYPPSDNRQTNWLVIRRKNGL